MEATNLAETLAGTYLFRDLSPQEVGAILKGSRDLAFSDGEYAFREGDAARDMLFLVTGELEVRKKVPTGEETVLTTLRAPTAVGEIAFLLHGIRNASGRAKGEVTLLSMSRENLEAVIRNDPHAAALFLYGLAKLLAARLHHADEALLRP